MTKTEAHALLNAVKDGAPAWRRQINQALRATGDIGRDYRTAPAFSGLLLGSELDEIDCWPIKRVHRAPGQWERTAPRKMLAPAHPFDVVMA